MPSKRTWNKRLFLALTREPACIKFLRFAQRRERIILVTSLYKDPTSEVHYKIANMQFLLHMSPFGLVALLLTLTSTHALPTTTSSPAEPTASPVPNASLQHSTAGIYNCLSSSAQSRPELADCARAIIKLPQITGPQTFRGNGPRGEPFALPKTYTSGRCRASIQMQDGAREDSSDWAVIHNSFQDILMGCLAAPDLSGKYRTGGMAVGVGDRGKLILAIDKVAGAVGDGDDKGDADGGIKSGAANATAVNELKVAEGSQPGVASA
ncbi:MAG: hypothetical protein Q9164_001689 [Protoblastenia rupestris]